MNYADGQTDRQTRSSQLLGTGVYQGEAISPFTVSGFQMPRSLGTDLTRQRG